MNAFNLGKTGHFDDVSYRLLVDSVKDYAIFMLDPNGYIVSWNKGAERIKGYTAGEIIGQHFSRFYPPESIDAGRPDIALAIAAMEGKYEEEGWRVRKDGSRFWAHVLITVLHDGDGEIEGFAKVTQDMTERKQAEEALQQAYNELEHRVQERTTQLQKEIEIRKASEKRLRELSRYLQTVREKERSRVAREIHDELGGLLTVLKMDISRYTERYPAPATSASLQDADQMLGLADAAINALRSIMDNLHPSLLEHLGLWAALEWAVEQFQSVSHIDTTFQKTGTERPVDPVRTSTIYHLFQEILDNAAHHANATHVDILVDVDATRFTLQIKDNGIGITEQQVADDASCGIAAMIERIHTLDGVFDITGQPGIGTTVAVEIPLP